jgi:hypothetical protein
MSMTEDFTVFFNVADFAETATANAVSGTLIYDENGSVVEEFGVDVSGPAAVCPTTQWPAIAEGDTIDILFASGTRSFKVRVVSPIDDGALKLLQLVRL